MLMAMLFIVQNHGVNKTTQLQKIYGKYPLTGLWKLLCYCSYAFYDPWGYSRVLSSTVVFYNPWESHRWWESRLCFDYTKI